MPYTEYKLGGGVNLKAPATDIADDELVEARGCVFDTIGAVSSTRGRKQYTGLGSRIYGHVDAYDASGKFRITKAGADVYQDNTDIGDFSATGQLSGVSYNGYAYLVDGSNIKRKSRTGSLEDAGLDAPGAGLTLGSSGSGNGTSAGTYLFWVSFYNGVVESNLSTPVSVTISAGEQFDLTAIPTGGSTVTERRIYRSDVNKSSPFYIATISDNTTTTYTDTGALPTGAHSQASAGDDATDEAVAEPEVSVRAGQHYEATAAMQTTYGSRLTSLSGRPEVRMTNLGLLADWTDHDPPPTGLRHLTVLQEALWGIADNKAWFTLTTQPESWSRYRSFPVGRQTGDTLLAVEPIGQSAMACYTDSGISVYTITGLSAEDGRLDPIANAVGLAAEWAIADVVLGGTTVHIYLGRQGIYLFDGQSAVEISQPIEGIFTDPLHADYVHPDYISSAVAGSLRDKVWLSYGRNSVNDRTIFIDFGNPRQPRFAIYNDYGFTTIVREHKEQKLVAGDADGNLYELATDASESVTWTPRTKSYGNAHLAKFTEISLDADLGDASTTVTATTDLGRSDSWTIANWRGRKKKRYYLENTMMGYSLDVKLSSASTNQRHWYGLGVRDEPGASP